MNRQNKLFFLSVFIICLLITTTVTAAVDINHDKIRLQSLNKATAETSTFEVSVGDTIRLGPLYIRPQACRTAPVTEEPESAGFLQIWTVNEPKEEGAKAKSEWVFSGWMFASSPGLSSMDHAVYDLWVLDCGKDAAATVVSATVEEKESEELEDADDTMIIEEDDSGDAPIVKLGGQEIYVPETGADSESVLEEAPEVMPQGEADVPPQTEQILQLPEEQPSGLSADITTPDEVPADQSDQEDRFQAYDEDESAPTVRLE